MGESGFNWGKSSICDWRKLLFGRQLYMNCWIVKWTKYHILSTYKLSLKKIVWNSVWKTIGRNIVLIVRAKDCHWQSVPTTQLVTPFKTTFQIFTTNHTTTIHQIVEKKLYLVQNFQFSISNDWIVTFKYYLSIISTKDVFIWYSETQTNLSFKWCSES